MRSRLLIALATAVTVAGCGGGSASNAGQTRSGTGSVSPASTPSTAASASTPTTQAATSPPTTTVLAPSTCRATDLAPSFLGGQAATGHGLLGFALRNVSGRTCTTFGYPGVQFLSRSGQPLPTSPTHTTQDFFGSLPKLPLTVSPGDTVSFRLGVTHGAATTNGCTTAWALQVIPPNDTSTVHVSIANGAYECQTATVSPMQRGTSAYP